MRYPGSALSRSCLASRDESLSRFSRSAPGRSSRTASGASPLICSSRMVVASPSRSVPPRSSSIDRYETRGITSPVCSSSCLSRRRSSPSVRLSCTSSSSTSDEGGAAAAAAASVAAAAPALLESSDAAPPALLDPLWSPLGSRLCLLVPPMPRPTSTPALLLRRSCGGREEGLAADSPSRPPPMYVPRSVLRPASAEGASGGGIAARGGGIIVAPWRVGECDRSSLGFGVGLPP